MTVSTQDPARAGRVVPHAEAAAHRSRLGGKAAHLLDLERGGLPVPPWFCVTTAAFESVLARTRGAVDSVVRGLSPNDSGAVRAASERIAALMQTAGLDDQDRAAILATFDALFPPEARVAVRSSCVDEDSERDSFAGRMDSFLEVPRSRVPERVLDVFASAFSARAIHYRAARGRAQAEVVAAALVQRMVESDISGILFTAHPETGDTSEAVISAGFGLGEGVVGDRVETDTWFVERATGRIRESRIGAKRTRVVFDAASGEGTRIAAVPDERALAPALSEPALAALLALGARAEGLLGGPQDIEWAIGGDGQLFLLQSRPISTLPAGRALIFDNSNIVEGYPGLSLPLTFSFARAGYEEALRGAATALGATERVLDENAAVFSSLIALVDGRIYYNIMNWYRLYLLLPGYERFLPAWEKALGLEHMDLRPPAPRSFAERVRSLIAMERGFRSTLLQLVFLPASVRRFESAFAQALVDFRRQPLDALDAEELVALYERLARRMLRRFSLSLVNDIFTQQSYELLGKLITRWGLGEATPLRNDLLCGETGMESVEPVRSLLSIAEFVRGDPGLVARLPGGAPVDQVWNAIRNDPALTELRARIDEHIARYGDRTVSELKLETPPVEEDPAFLLAALRRNLEGSLSVDAMTRREQAVRAAAEARVGAALAQHPLRRFVFTRLLRLVRRTVKTRENLRLARSRAFGMVRRIFRELGRRLADARRIEAPGDVFCLTVDEVISEVRGLAVTRDLAALIELRRRDYAGFAARSLPGRVTVRGLPYAKPFARATTSSTGDANELRGLGCAGGRVSAPARVVLDPSDDLDLAGHILVAPATDPAWAFLMVSAKGIVVERGSPLSHTAIIGRELGIPTVVAVAGATTRIRDGQRIEIDGQTGTVRLIEADGAATDPVANLTPRSDAGR